MKDIKSAMNDATIRVSVCKYAYIVMTVVLLVMQMVARKTTDSLPVGRPHCNRAYIHKNNKESVVVRTSVRNVERASKCGHQLPPPVKFLLLPTIYWIV